jgi:anaerobic magnesium-protoporphyrin IX monomethyl ester cyclase
MKIALVYNYAEPNAEFSTITAQERHMGVIPPISLAYVAAIIERAGHTVMIIDAPALRLSAQETARRITEFGPELVGFTITTYTFYETLAWIRYIKQRCDLPVMIGGTHVGLFPRETMTHPEIDYAFIGETELSLPLFLAEFGGGKNFITVPGLCYRKNGVLSVTPPAAVLPDMDAVPFPARRLLPNAKYYSFVSRRKNFTAMVTTRGCIFKCIYCTSPGTLRMRSARNVVDEIEEAYRECNIREIDIYDTAFTVDKKRVFDICDDMLRRKLDINWTVRTRVDLVDKEILGKMASAGCRMAMYGIESADPAILHAMHKNTDVGRIRDAVRWTRSAGISPFGFFMIGSPGETRETVLRTIRFAKELDLDFVQFTKTTAFPGTELYERYMKESHDDYWRAFVRDPSVKRGLPLVGTEMKAAEAQQLVRRAYLEFYSRPLYIVRIIFWSGSLIQCFRFLQAFIDMLIGLFERKRARGE